VPLVIEVELLAIKRGQGEQGMESFAPDPFSAGISL
jgi:hypothetical protein